MTWELSHCGLIRWPPPPPPFNHGTQQSRGNKQLHVGKHFDKKYKHVTLTVVRGWLGHHVLHALDSGPGMVLPVYPIFKQWKVSRHFWKLKQKTLVTLKSFLRWNTEFCLMLSLVLFLPHFAELVFVYDRFCFVTKRFIFISRWVSGALSPIDNVSMAFKVEGSRAYGHVVRIMQTIHRRKIRQKFFFSFFKNYFLSSE